MKYIKNINIFILEKSSDILYELISMFDSVLAHIDKNSTFEEYKRDIDKGKITILLKFVNTKSGYIDRFKFIKSFLNELLKESNNDLSICDVIEQNKVRLAENYYSNGNRNANGRYIIIKRYPDDTITDYIKVIIKYLSNDLEFKKINKLKDDYKNTLKRHFGEKRDGIYFDPENAEEDADDLKHQSIASDDYIVPILLKYYKPYHKLLDIGSGLGNILRICKKIGYDATGIEIRDNKRYTRGLNVIYSDFFNVDNEIISKFDIIYFYRPFQFNNEMNRILQKISDGAKSGAIMLYHYPHLEKKELEKDFPKFKFIENTITGGHNVLIFEKI